MRKRERKGVTIERKCHRRHGRHAVTESEGPAEMICRASVSPWWGTRRSLRGSPAAEFPAGMGLVGRRRQAGCGCGDFGGWNAPSPAARG